MSQKEINQINKVYRRIVIGAAAVLAVLALIYNPGHLITASMIYIFGATSEFKKSK